MKIVSEVLKLQGSYVLVTYDQIILDSKLIAVPENCPTPFQKVVKVGQHCTLVKEDDEVFVDWEKYIKVFNAAGRSVQGDIEGIKAETKLIVPLFELKGQTLALISEQAIIAVIKSEEETKEQKKAREAKMAVYVNKTKVKQKPDLILPESAKTSKKIVIPKGNVSVKDVK